MGGRDLSQPLAGLDTGNLLTTVLVKFLFTVLSSLTIPFAFKLTLSITLNLLTLLSLPNCTFLYLSALLFTVFHVDQG